MSWAWRDAIHLHVSASFSLLRTGCGDVEVLHGPWLDVPQMLDAIPLRSSSRWMKPELFVTLGASLCPAVDCGGIDRLSRRADRIEAARDAAAEGLGLDPSGVAFACDGSRRGVLAASPADLLDTIRRLAKDVGVRLGSIEPLWAAASRSRACGRDVNALLVAEPDAVTMIAERRGGSLLGTTLAGPACEGSATVLFERWLQLVQIDSEHALRMTFGAENVVEVSPLAPRPWQERWVVN